MKNRLDPYQLHHGPYHPPAYPKLRTSANPATIFPGFRHRPSRISCVFL